MNIDVKAWIDKAEGDYRVALRELAVTDEAAFDAVCFHAQQCVEKLLKALLMQGRVEPPYTHNLLELADLVVKLHPTLDLDRSDLRYLTRGGVLFRYPGESATASHAASAMEICKRLRAVLLRNLEAE